MRVLALALALLVGCGRIGFDVRDDGATDTTPDALATPVTITDVWSRRYGAGGTDSARAVAIDATGLLHVSGNFSGTVNFGDGGVMTLGSDDVYVVALDAAGTFVRKAIYGGAGQDFGFALAPAADGRMFVGGSFRQTLDVGTQIFTAVNEIDAWMSELSPTGVPGWAKQYGAALTDQVFGLAVAPDALYVLVHASAANDYGGGTRGTASSHMVVVRLDLEGNHVWSHAFVPTIDVNPGGVVADPATGDVYIVGTLDGDLDAGGGSLPPLGASDGLVLALDRDGNHRWSRRVGGPGGDGLFDVGLAPDGTVVAGGERASDAYVVALDAATGDVRWERAYGSPTAFDIVHDLAVTTSGVLAAGTHEAPFTLDRPDITLATGVHAGLSDLHVAAFASDGTPRGLFAAGSADNDTPISITAAGGRAYVAGVFIVTLPLPNSTLTSAGQGDGFVVAFDVSD